MSDIEIFVGDWVRDEFIGLPNGRHEFVIGDVHGNYDSFSALLGAFKDAARGLNDAGLTMLGDLVDRGPRSLDCVKLAAQASDIVGIPSQLLMGNHETMMLASLGLYPKTLLRFSEAREVWYVWNRNGGHVVLEEMQKACGDEWDALKWEDRLLRSVGQDAFKMLVEAGNHVRTGNLLLCHAGIAGGADIKPWFATDAWPVYRENDSWAWVRSDFFNACSTPFYDGEQAITVVHGHTMETLLTDEREFPKIHQRDGWRIGLDGGSYQSSIVTGAEFRDGHWRLFGAGNSEHAMRRGIIFPKA